MSSNVTSAAASSATPPTIGETLLVAVCRLAAGRAAQVLPKPLEPVSDEAFVYLVWATLNAQGLPVRAQSFVESNIAIPCRGPAGPGTWFLRAYFPWQDLVRNAYLSGWSSGAAQVEVGRVPRMVQRLVWPPKHAIGGWVAREGRRELEMTLVPGDDVDLASTPLAHFYKVYGVRQVGGRGDVTLEHHFADVMHRVTTGEVELKVSGDVADALGPYEVTSGYLVEFGIVYGGSRAV